MWLDWNQPGPGLTSPSTARLVNKVLQSCPALSAVSDTFNFLFSSVSLGGIWLLVQNVRIIWREQLELITDNYLLVGAIKSWSFPRERHLLFDNISTILSGLKPTMIDHGGQDDDNPQFDNTVLFPIYQICKKLSPHASNFL